ncbi:hypothetical protein [Nostoc sp.]|uniref:hypothetical protein n=1 Tax=Nostoc sp. TaxID=1180 RepID=UPI002FF89914
MKLGKAELTEGYPHFRLISENGIWELGIPEIQTNGIRVCAGKVNSNCYEIIYYAGFEKGMALSLLGLVSIIMSELSETVSYPEFKATFPVQTVKPILEDLKCWEALNFLATDKTISE